MKKKYVSLIIVFCICVCSFVSYSVDVLAMGEYETSEIENDINYSGVTNNNLLVGYATIPRGIYLASGNSSISKQSSYQIGASGITNAAVRCDVSITTIVERYNMETDRWAFITSWTASKENAFSAAISKSLVVDSGYYYRVRSLHYAATDASSSYTNALYVGN